MYLEYLWSPKWRIHGKPEQKGSCRNRLGCCLGCDCPSLLGPIYLEIKSLSWGFSSRFLFFFISPEPPAGVQPSLVIGCWGLQAGSSLQPVHPAVCPHGRGECYSSLWKWDLCRGGVQAAKFGSDMAFKQRITQGTTSVLRVWLVIWGICCSELQSGAKQRGRKLSTEWGWAFKPRECCFS